MNSTKIISLLAPYGSMKFAPLATKVGAAGGGDNGKTPPPVIKDFIKDSTSKSVG